MKTVSLLRMNLLDGMLPKQRCKNQKLSESSERFLREARICARLEHPNIVPLHDLGVDEQGDVFTMKLVEGISFQELINEIKINKSEYSLNELWRFLSKFAMRCLCAFTANYPFGPQT